MELNNLTPAAGSVKTAKRVGRGAGSGLGGTSTRGHKGAKSRSGYSKKIGFEGGQMPMQRRLPKFGFKNINRVEYKAINLATLQALAEAKKLEKIGLIELHEAGFISKTQLVKILGNGSVTKALTVTAHAFSKSAEAAIAAAGLKKADAQKALDATMSAIVEALKKGEKVQLIGFGTFSVVEKAARKGINPATKAVIEIPAKKVVKFKAGAKVEL